MTEKKTEAVEERTEELGIRPRRRWAPLGVLIVITVVPAVLYVTYVVDQLRQVGDRNLRLIADVAERLDDVLSNTRTTVRNLAADLGRHTDASERIRKWDDRQRYLDARWRLRVSPTLSNLNRVVFVRDADALLIVGQGSDSQLLEPRFEVNLERILGELPLNNAFRLLAPVASELAAESVFDYLLVADDSGSVVMRLPEMPAFGENRSGLRIEHVDQLASGEEGEKLDFEDLKRSSVVRDVVVAEREFQLYCQPLGLQGLVEVSSENPIVGGEPQSTTWVVCGLVGSERALEESLKVAPQLALLLVLVLAFGLMTWPFLKLFFMDRRERLPFADAYLLLVCTFAFLLITSMLLVDADSYLDLRNRAEVRLEALADQVERNFGAEIRALYDQLDTYDGQLCERYSARLQDLFDGLSEDTLWADQTMLLKGGQAAEAPRGEPRYRYFDSVFWMNAEGRQFAKATVQRQNTPAVTLDHRIYFQRVAEERLWTLAGEPGRRFAFETTRSVTTGERFAALSKPSCLYDEFRDSVVIGAEKLSCDELARSVGADDARGNACLVVAAIIGVENSPVSVMEPVLPPGFGFAIIDRQGRVQFHSDGRRALQENLFDEVTDVSRLRAAVHSMSGQHFNTRYFTKPHQVYVRPLAVMPWWIVTFHDQEILRTANLEALSHAIILGVLYFVGLNLLPLLFLAIRRREATFLWPDDAKQPLYRRAVLHNSVLLVLSLVALFLTPEHVGVAIWVILPALALILLLLNYRYWWLHERPRKEAGPIPTEASPETRSRRTRRLLPPLTFWSRLSPLTVHVAAASLLWVLIAVLPGVGFFKIAWHQQLELMFKDETLELATDLDHREQRVEAYYRRVPTADLRKEVVDRTEVRRDLYLAGPDTVRHPGEPDTLRGPSIFGTALMELEQDPEGTERAHGFSAWLARYKPFYNLTSLRTRYLAGAVSDRAAGAADASWILSNGKGYYRIGGDDGQWLVGKNVIWPPKAGWFVLIGGVSLLVILVLWVRHSALYLFFARVDRQATPKKIAAVLNEKSPSNAIVLIASPRDRRALLESPKHVRVDLEGPDQKSAQVQLKDAGKQLVVCDHFEAGLDDQEVRDWKLRQLETLVFTLNCTVIIPSALNPLEDLFWFGRALGADAALAGSVSGRGPVRLEPDEARRWGRLLSEFGVTPVALTPPEPKTPPGVSRQEKLERELEAAEGYYWALWTACSEEEKLVLVHLAQERIVNPKQAPTVRRLLQRGLLVRDPHLRLVNDCFTLFVLRIHQPLEIARLERTTRGYGWKNLRWAFLSVLAVIALFLFATQRALFDATIGFISALVIGVPGLLKLIGTLQQGGGRRVTS